MRYIEGKEVASMIRQALKESFAGVKFSVRLSRYSGGSSIRVGWVDGPNSAQVEAVIGVFEGSYFDGSQDFKGSRYAMIDGQQVRFCVDFVFASRENSDAAVQRAIDRVYRMYQGNFSAMGFDKPSVKQYRSGELIRVCLSPDFDNNFDLSSLINVAMSKASDRLAVAKSKMVGKVIYLGNDGYSERGALQVQE